MKFIKKIISCIKKRKKYKKGSYTSIILKDRKYIRKKIAEEAFEFCCEIKKKPNKKKFVNEFCDILFHSLVIFEYYKINFKLVKKEMIRRNNN
ncbi:phosphoribosyl-ATP diphosphatase [Candidatus Vidania fulgoroideorum]